MSYGHDERDPITVPPWEELTSLDLRASGVDPHTSGPDPRASGPFYALPEDEPASGRPSRGILAGAAAGFVAVAAMVGVANIAAIFFRPQASPTIAAGGAFLDHAPSWLKDLGVGEFGANDRNMLLLLGMYVMLVLLAMAIGVVAWRHVSVGVAAVALFGGLGALLAVTRPESRATDMIPSLVGGVTGIVAITWVRRRGLGR